MPRGKKKSLHPELYQLSDVVPPVPLVPEGLPFPLIAFALVPAKERGLFRVAKVTLGIGLPVYEYMSEADSRMLCLNTLHHLAVKQYEYPVGASDAA